MWSLRRSVSITSFDCPLFACSAFEKTFSSIKESIANAIQTLKSEDPEALLDQRRARYKAIGEFNEN